MGRSGARRGARETGARRHLGGRGVEGEVDPVGLRGDSLEAESLGGRDPLVEEGADRAGVRLPKAIPRLGIVVGIVFARGDPMQTRPGQDQRPGEPD